MRRPWRQGEDDGAEPGQGKRWILTLPVAMLLAAGLYLPSLSSFESWVVS